MNNTSMLWDFIGFGIMFFLLCTGFALVMWINYMIEKPHDNTKNKKG